jgi:predicted AAA+ superfamily ATPase
MLFEHLVFTQLYHAAHVHLQQVRISNYRTEHSAEIDLIVENAKGEVTAVECKASRNVGRNDLSGFNSFAKFYGKSHRKIVIYGGTIAKQIDDVMVLPFRQGIASVFESLV